MVGGRRSILIDARVNALPGAHGLAAEGSPAELKARVGTC
jgi:hypothetical protein